jgi:Co/Zn/Cd efflux system component
MNDPRHSLSRSPPSHQHNYGDDEQITKKAPRNNVSYLSDDDDDLDISCAVEMVPVQLHVARTLARTTPDDELDRDRPSNERLLLTAFFSFFGFTCAQSVAAFIADSEAMKGDSAAMAVDALTYLFNLIAERRKSRFEEHWPGTDETDPERRKRIKERAKRKMTLRLEIIPPVLSVTTLVLVTADVLHSSLTLLLLDSHRDRSEQGDPNVNLMLGFASLNLLLDAVNVICFARAKRLCGYNTSNEHTHTGTGADARKKRSKSKNYASVGSGDFFENEVGGHDDHDESNYGNGMESESSSPPEEEEEQVQEEANLNMCSAYTHVFADTLRSIAVVVAAGLAEVVDGITSEEADAAAAVTVSILIILSLMPLLHGLWMSVSELRAIQAEERDEKLYPPTNGHAANHSNDMS